MFAPSLSTTRRRARRQAQARSPRILALAALVWCGGAMLVAQTTGPAYDSSTKDTQEAQPVDAIETEASLRFDIVAGSLDQRINELLARMTLSEKIGQLVQVYPDGEQLPDELKQQIQNGEIGSIFYTGNAALVREAQQIAKNESRLGIPLVVARDVVHGFRTVFPIPLGQAATWNPDLVAKAAEVAANEAKSEGIDWTFAPMVDISRDPRWGRIAETLGEDPKLAGDLAAAMVRGFQQQRDGELHGIAACAKHFVAYGLSEGGRDYNRASVSEVDLNNIYLPPFQACVDAGCWTMMTTFSEVNGIPGTAHGELINGVLKRDWQFSGLVVSDWGSVTEMITHGYSPDERSAAKAALMAGVDMEMCSPTYATHLRQLVRSGEVPESRIDDAVRRVLKLKVATYRSESQEATDALMLPASLDLARQAAQQSIVLLKNDGALPLAIDEGAKLAIVGPMANRPQQQLGCWSLDGKPEDSITPLQHLRQQFADKAEVVYAPGAKNSFSSDASLIAEAVEAAKEADVAVLFVGEDATLSGEARSRASLELPGVQRQLIEQIAATQTPTIVVVLAGRPLAIGNEVQASDAVLYAWHPGTMAGPAIGDVLSGKVSPSGKLPVTFPQSVGQIPLYYSHTNTGRPAPDGYKPLIGSDASDLAPEFQYRSHYLDIEPEPLFPFGYGLSYAEFEYEGLELTSSTIRPTDVLGVRVTLTNKGDVAGTEVTQVYVRDQTASIVRPVRELKAYRRTHLEPGESKVLEFALPASSLAYFDDEHQVVLEAGDFEVFVGTDSTATLGSTFQLLETEQHPKHEEIASPQSAGTGAPTAR